MSNQNEQDSNKVGLFSRIKSSKFGLPLLAIVIAAVVTGFLLASSPEVVEEKNEFPPLVVEVSKALADEALRSSVFQGEVRAKTDIELVTQVTGKVISVSDKFVEGGQFAADETILQIDDADYRVALKSAEATVAEAEVELDIELASAETSKREWLDVIGESIDNADPLRLNQPQVQRARARLDAANAQLSKAKLDYSRTKISAPFAARIKNKSAEVGQFISRGNSVAGVFSTEAVEIRIPMSDRQITELGLGLGQMRSDATKLKAVVTSSFGSKDRSESLHKWQGYLKSVDASIDAETRLLYGTVVVDEPLTNNSMPLAPGLFVNVELDASKKVAGVSIPREALRNGNRVYVVQDGKLRFRQVSTLFTSKEIAVLSNTDGQAVSQGDKVVTSPVPGAFDGMAVEIKGAIKAAAVTEGGEQQSPEDEEVEPI